MPALFWIIIGVWGGLSLLTPFAVAAWQLRYFYLPGRIRVEFISPRNTVNSVIKLGKSAESFEVEIFGRKRKFKLDVDRMRISGRERLPKYWYYIGDVVIEQPRVSADGQEERQEAHIDLYEPLDMNDVRVTYATSGGEYRDAATNNVMQNLLVSFKRKVIDSTIALLITLGAMLIGFAGLAFFIESKFKGLE